MLFSKCFRHTPSFTLCYCSFCLEFSTAHIKRSPALPAPDYYWNIIFSRILFLGMPWLTYLKLPPHFPPELINLFYSAFLKKSFSPAFNNVLRVESSLIIREFCIWDFIYSLKFIVTSKFISKAFSWSFLDMCRVARNLGHLTCNFPAEVNNAILQLLVSAFIQ